MIRLSNVLCLINERGAVVDILKRHVDHVPWTDRRAVLMSSCRVICHFPLLLINSLYSSGHQIFLFVSELGFIWLKMLDVAVSRK